MKRLSTLLFCCLILPVVACGGGGGGGGGGPVGPTAPPPPASQLLLNLGLVSVTAGGLQEAVLSLDGREVARPVCNPVQPCQMTATVSGVARGSHRVTVTIVRQSRQFITYQTIGQADFVDSAGSRSVPLEPKRPTLRVGDSVNYDISL